MKMATHKLPCSLVLVLSILFISATFSAAHKREDPRQDPELLQCTLQCRAQKHISESETQQCEKDCEDYVKQKHQGQGGGDEWNIMNLETKDPQRQLQECQAKCHQHRQAVAQRELCERRCQKKYEERQKEQGGQEGDSGQQEQEQEESPYVFRKERIGAQVSSKEGRIAILERFNRRSELLDGIENYRVALVEISPNAFMLPDHWDADTIIMVVNGQGSMTIIEQENKETHQLKRGDVMRLRAGSIVHTLNTDKKEKLIVAELVIPVSTPGQFEAFSAAGHKGLESFFNAFSDEIIQAAFNTDAERVKKMFNGQNEGPFVKASEKQIKALSKSSSKSSKQSTKPYNLLNQRPLESNKYGALYEINTKEYKQLQDLDVKVSYANITKGGMIAPYYNSRSTKIAVVVSGVGYIEMACPHLSSRQGEGGEYERVSAKIRSGDVYVVPAGHPTVALASDEENFEVVCFEINAEDNQRIPLVGKDSVLKQLQDEAKELSFNVEAKQVNEILDKQKESWFLPGPAQQRKQQGGDASE